MFDYQAGEKFKLTLIMVGFAGLMAGMLFTMLLMPTSEPPAARHRARPAYANNSDITGVPNDPRYGGVSPMAMQAAQGQAGMAQPGAANDGSVPAQTAISLVEQWLPLAWDLSAGTARNDQEKAIAYMTPECAQAYKQNIWTPDLAQQIEQSGVRSTFSPKKVAAGQTNADGSIVIFVEGEQVLDVPGKGAHTRPVKTEYLVRNTADGLRIAGISEGG